LEHLKTKNEEVSKMRKNLYVISGTVQEFDHFALSKFNTNTIYRYVRDVNSLQGIQNPDGIFIGSWKQRSDIFQLLQVLLTRMISVKKRNAILAIYDYAYLYSLSKR